MSYKAQLDALLKQRGIGGIGVPMPSIDFSVGSIDWARLGLYALVVTLLIVLILTVVHFTIRPIFRIRSGSNGLITIPGIRPADDGEVYWPTISHSTLAETDSIFAGSSASATNYSLAIDLLFNNLNIGTNADNRSRPVFLRYNNSAGIPTEKFNLGMFLQPDVNDLDVVLRTSRSDQVKVTLKNVPSKQPIRVGVCVYSTHFEVYRNGLLVGTKKLANPPSTDIGTIWCSPGYDATTGAQVSTPNCSQGSGGESTLGYGINLHLWTRGLQAKEMQFSTPNMPSLNDFLQKADSLRGYYTATAP